jgi:hypothetical protein
MSAALKAHVRWGRLVLDEPTDLPEGSEVPLVPPSDRHIIETAIAHASHEDLLAHAERIVARLREISMPVPPWADLDGQESAELDRALQEGLEEARAGHVVPHEEALRVLRRARQASEAPG